MVYGCDVAPLLEDFALWSLASIDDPLPEILIQYRLTAGNYSSFGIRSSYRVVIRAFNSNISHCELRSGRLAQADALDSLALALSNSSSCAIVDEADLNAYSTLTFILYGQSTICCKDTIRMAKHSSMVSYVTHCSSICMLPNFLRDRRIT
jgi:hypothetical protein